MRSLVDFICESKKTDTFSNELVEKIVKLDGFDSSVTVYDAVIKHQPLYTIQLTSKSKGVKWTSVTEFTDETMEYVRDYTAASNGALTDEQELVQHYNIVDYKKNEKSQTGFGFSFSERGKKYSQVPVYVGGTMSDGLTLTVASEDNMKLIVDNIKTILASK